ncbi:MAG: ABC transporter substrate-binding protein [Lachnospiraceae bacterium]|nr:ABC transporter substrate-binding protein [Lachnospiraceae bacterium]
MKKKLLAMVMAGAMVLGLAACGEAAPAPAAGDAAPAADAGAAETAAPSGGSGEGIRLVNGKIEVDAMLKEAAALYEEETGKHVEIESMGGGVNIQDTLKGYYQADNMPDIFVCGSDADFGNWDGMLVDMSGEKWASDTDAAYKNDFGTIGFPYTTEAIGLAYNADLLEKAGVDPKSITGPDAMKKAFETLDSKKDELGLTAVIGWCTEPKDLYWSTGSHSFANYLDSGLSRDDTTYSDMLADGGKIDETRFEHYAEMVGLFNQYSDPALLTSGTYDQQILGFASGKYAFVTQGSWIGATMTSDDKDAYAEAGNFKCGMAPYAFEDGIDTILTNSPSWWAVFDNDNKADSLAFLQWLSEDKGQEILVMKAGFISPFKSCTFVAEDPFAATISEYTAAGKTSSWHWLKNKAGMDQNALGQVYADYALGTIPDAKAFTSTVSQVLQQYYAE